jgi:hypothetical protein
MFRQTSHIAVKLLLAFAAACLPGLPTLSAQKAVSSITEVPADIHYKRASDSTNAAAEKLLTPALSPNQAVPAAFFDTTLTCGPTLWNAMKPNASKVVLDSTVIVALINSIQVEARGLITNEQRQAFWKSLLNKYPSLQSAKVRRATLNEIRYYWATVPFDIEEPFFTIDTGEQQFIANFRMENGKPKLLWIDIVDDLEKLTAKFGNVVDLKVLQMMAESGNPASMLQLGEAYFVGNSVPVDYKQAAVWMEKAADKGSLRAQMFIGSAYYSGYKFSKDKVLAAKYLLLAANQGNSFAQFYVAQLYKNGEALEKSPIKAVQYMQAAVAQDSSIAEYELGVWYSTGDGVPLDKKKSCDLYERASREDNRAANNLGSCYQYGEGREKDLAKAIIFYTKAAEAGNTRAQGNAAILCGQAGDWKQSYVWMRIAENLGSIQNRPAIDRVKAYLTPDEVAAAETNILDWEKNHPAKK